MNYPKTLFTAIIYILSIFTIHPNELNASNFFKERKYDFQDPSIITVKEFERLIKLDYKTVKSELLSRGWKLELEEMPNSENQYFYCELSSKLNEEFVLINLYIGTDPNYAQELDISIITDSKKLSNNWISDFTKINTDFQKMRINGNDDPNNIEKLSAFEMLKCTDKYGYGIRHEKNTNIKKPIWSLRIKNEFIEFIDFERDIESFKSLKIETEHTL